MKCIIILLSIYSPNILFSVNGTCEKKCEHNWRICKAFTFVVMTRKLCQLGFTETKFYQYN